jgi:hypothetical protein
VGCCPAVRPDQIRLGLALARAPLAPCPSPCRAPSPGLFPLIQFSRTQLPLSPTSLSPLCGALGFGDVDHWIWIPVVSPLLSLSPLPLLPPPRASPSHARPERLPSRHPAHPWPRALCRLDRAPSHALPTAHRAASPGRAPRPPRPRPRAPPWSALAHLPGAPSCRRPRPPRPLAGPSRLSCPLVARHGRRALAACPLPRPLSRLWPRACPAASLAARAVLVNNI